VSVEVHWRCAALNVMPYRDEGPGGNQSGLWLHKAGLPH
jgi:hypothetical protein